MLPTDSSPRSRRAAPMAPDDRRRAILDVTVPLLLEHGAALTTKQVAEAAGIAEGTIFRVFPDKAALLHAAAEDVLAPAALDEIFAASLDGVTGLRERVLVATERLDERAEKVMAVMMAMRAAFTGDDHRTDRQPRGGPPQYFLDSQHALLELLTRVFAPHADELSVPPRTAALLLRTLVLGSRHPGGGPQPELTTDRIADVLLDGIRHPAPGAGRRGGH